MSLRTVTKSTLKCVEGISSREFRAAVFVCVVVTALNALAVSHSIGYGEGHAAGAYPCWVPQQLDIFYDLMRVKIELALLVIAIALWSKRVLGLWISLIATLFIHLQYALWYLDTQRWFRELHVSDFSQLPKPSEWQHFAGIYQATPWDFVILVFTTALFIWQVRVIVALITSARRRQKSA